MSKPTRGQINEIRQEKVNELLKQLVMHGTLALGAFGATSLEMWGALKIFARQIETNPGWAEQAHLTEAFLAALPERHAAADEFMDGKRPS